MSTDEIHISDDAFEHYMRSIEAGEDYINNAEAGDNQNTLDEVQVEEDSCLEHFTGDNQTGGDQRSTLAQVEIQRCSSKDQTGAHKRTFEEANIPKCSSEADTVSILDDAIRYVTALKQQVEMKPFMIQASFQGARPSILPEVAGVPIPHFPSFAPMAPAQEMMRMQQLAGGSPMVPVPTAAFLHPALPFLTSPLTYAAGFPGQLAPFLNPNLAAASSLDPSTSSLHIPPPKDPGKEQ
ncbi:hypothetical protein Tsubulata_029841 [Turnera subulata]|uniref:BHLH domain-containing protein n=1 Tax=Turnera subulata TaxID=218843 RepID=A0A9Q0FHF5_9ROSI|nr:hypothetical protein Tsubulata_029841 [Turnera subulata]